MVMVMVKLTAATPRITDEDQLRRSDARCPSHFTGDVYNNAIEAATLTSQWDQHDCKSFNKKLTFCRMWRADIMQRPHQGAYASRSCLTCDTPAEHPATTLLMLVSVLCPWYGWQHQLIKDHGCSTFSRGTVGSIQVTQSQTSCHYTQQITSSEQYCAYTTCSILASTNRAGLGLGSSAIISNFNRRNFASIKFQADIVMHRETPQNLAILEWWMQRKHICKPRMWARISGLINDWIVVEKVRERAGGRRGGTGWKSFPELSMTQSRIMCQPDELVDHRTHGRCCCRLFLSKQGPSSHVERHTIHSASATGEILYKSQSVDTSLYALITFHLASAWCEFSPLRNLVEHVSKWISYEDIYSSDKAPVSHNILASLHQSSIDGPGVYTCSIKCIVAGSMTRKGRS
ncbi:predicted protein [Plenodomus lingam JN3]|uniref:Predicted protein n=1 Tax=Leptosphaeria maculans (strain JN3 / isolate v23.1.3 / race Av1-4-5-6-7-8) TaxID=985895 RepID=E4ZUH4_LEPMJ|nr:predicted protein [Plenodomus lingam JN3]CBX95053.1 predicted protein [Plenodomus lingam JN3]